MTSAFLLKENIEFGLANSFRSLVHYLHGGLQADMVLCLDPQATGSDLRATLYMLKVHLHTSPNSATPPIVPLPKGHFLSSNNTPSTVCTALTVSCLKEHTGVSTEDVRISPKARKVLHVTVRSFLPPHTLL